MTDVRCLGLSRIASLAATATLATLATLGATLGMTACHDSEATRQAGGSAAREAAPTEIRLDYATYNPSSLVLKDHHWLEDDLARDGISVRWVFSQGSNKANELLASGSADLVSTAGAAALLARTNGVPTKIVYVYSKPEWAALVVGADSPITQIADLKGKKVAATRGTDPFFFLLRSLEQAGLGARDIELVHLQHADGRLALSRGDVDAWAGLDPFLASAELREHARIIYRNVDFNSFGTLDAREDFLAHHPDLVRRVIVQYERARVWILGHPREAAQLVAAEAKLEPDVALRQLTERTGLDRDVGIPGPALHQALAAVAPLLTRERLVGPGADPGKALAELIDPSAAQAVIPAAAVAVIPPAAQAPAAQAQAAQAPAAQAPSAQATPTPAAQAPAAQAPAAQTPAAQATRAAPATPAAEPARP